MLKKNSKKPEERRKELIEVAARLFTQKGYEAVSVRDILDEVHGAPGMFYYYFRSKQDIYIAAMDSYIAERLARKCAIMEAESVPFEKKLEAFRELVRQDVSGYISRFESGKAQSVSDSSYRLWDLVQMLGKMVKPYAKMILQGIDEGKIENPYGIDEENAEAFAVFVLYGSFGMIYNDYFTADGNSFEFSDVVKMAGRLFQQMNTGDNTGR